MTAPLQLMSTLAVEVAFNRAILPRWRAAGREVAAHWAPTSVLAQEIEAGRRADVVVMIDGQLADLAARGVLRAGTITPIARANFGVAVRAGAPRPDIATPEAFFAAMQAARSVAYSLSGASGLYFARLMRAQGLGAVLDHGAPIPAGFTAEKLMTGEADLAVQQISELMTVEGAEVIGPFPDALQQPTDFSAAVFAEAADPDQALAFLAHLQEPASHDAYGAGGLVSRLAQHAA